MSTATTPPPELPEQPRKRKSRVLRILLWVFGTLLGLVLLLVVAALIILPSDWFREKIRARAVYEIEKASGGRVEIGAFRYDWSSLTFEIAPFVVHGTEPASEAPLFRAESVKVGLKIISAFKRDVDIASLYVEQPKVNLLVDASGTTNIPKPKTQTKSDKDPIEQILELA
ncbi:MAG: hypothetical protein H7Y20_17440, partial [Bryobacteraceae bacterium]|nr:hypothetical protein [Bryobacteraceae bacterium]